jgi:arsenite/tail-anchored protein-transporting ATPase
MGAPTWPPNPPPLGAPRRSRGAPRSPAHYHFFGGKGGVGKTTCAGAAAVARAERGHQVLIVSTDPAHSLGDLLGVRLGPAARLVPTRTGSLYAAELDADAALGRFVAARRGQLARILSRGTYLDDDDIERLLRLALPGVDELIGLLELTRLGQGRAYEDVVVDTAPTGHTLRLLAMPRTLERMAEVLDDMQAKYRFLAQSLGGGYRPDAADALVEEIAGDGRRLHALLRDPDRCAFSWILLPEALALEEARDAVAALRADGLSVGDIVVNRVTPEPRGRCVACEARVCSERKVVRTARRAFAGQELRLLPALAREPRGVAALRGLGRALPDRVGTIAPSRPCRSRSGRRALAHRGASVVSWLPETIQVVLLAGKGGVGKTTCAAALALALAERSASRRVLVLSADPAHSLGDALDVPLGDEARHPPGAPPGLHAREIDAPALMATRRRRYLDAVQEVFDALRGDSSFDPTFDRTVVEDLIDLAPPGLDELFGLLEVVDALDRSYDTVVVDTAPTGHALRLLEMPESALEWVHAFMEILLKYRKVIGLGDVGADLVALARDLRRLQALLRDPGRAQALVVTRAAALPRLETVRLVAALTRLGVTVGGVIVNALTSMAGAAAETLCSRCRQGARAEQGAVKTLVDDLKAAKRTPTIIVRAPAQVPPPRGVRALSRWQRRWELPSTPGGES